MTSGALQFPGTLVEAPAQRESLAGETRGDGSRFQISDRRQVAILRRGPVARAAHLKLRESGHPAGLEYFAGRRFRSPGCANVLQPGPMAALTAYADVLAGR